MNDAPERERGSSAGAWAAAALVLALGALAFAVIAHIRVTDLEGRVAVLESEIAAGREPLAELPADELPADDPSTDLPAAPSDEAAARAGVIAAFGSVYDPAAAIDDRVRMVDDPTGVGDALRQIAAGPNAVAVTSATVEVNDVNFTSPARAKVVYTVIAPGQAPISGREGEARVDGGTWKVTRATVCADLLAVGGNCG